MVSLREGEQMGVWMRQFVSMAPRPPPPPPPSSSSAARVCTIGSQPPSSTSWSSVSENTMLGQSAHTGPCAGGGKQPAPLQAGAGVGARVGVGPRA